MLISELFCRERIPNCRNFYIPDLEQITVVKISYAVNSWLIAVPFSSRYSSIFYLFMADCFADRQDNMEHVEERLVKLAI